MALCINVTILGGLRVLFRKGLCLGSSSEEEMRSVGEKVSDGKLERWEAKLEQEKPHLLICANKLAFASNK